jgi:hypothetical protein
VAIRGGMIANAKPKEVAIEAVITRADGRVERLGRIAYYHRNPLRRVAGNVSIWLRRHTCAWLASFAPKQKVSGS